MSGWVKLHRRINDHPLLSVNPVCEFVFIKLILNAAHKATVQDWRKKPISLRRGQIMISVAKIAEMTSFSTMQVRTALKGLKQYGCIEVTNANNKAPSIITVCNYDKFQSSPEDDNKADNKDLTNDLTTKQEDKNKNKSHARTRGETQINQFLTASQPEPQAEIQNNQIVLSPSARSYWRDMLQTDELLDLALVQIRPYVQEHSGRSVEQQVLSQLARIARERKDRDQRYQAAIEQRRPAEIQKQKAEETRKSAFAAALEKHKQRYGGQA